MNEDKAKIVAVLDAARDVLSNPERWTQEFLALDAEQDDTSPYGEDAVCWCLLGALARVIGPTAPADDAPVVRALADTIIARGFPIPTESTIQTARHCVSRFNDNPTTRHADVLAVLDQTIERLKRVEVLT